MMNLYDCIIYNKTRFVTLWKIYIYMCKNVSKDLIHIKTNVIWVFMMVLRVYKKLRYAVSR
jgi:hypothetical protein